MDQQLKTKKKEILGSLKRIRQYIITSGPSDKAKLEDIMKTMVDIECTINEDTMKIEEHPKKSNQTSLEDFIRKAVTISSNNL